MDPDAMALDSPMLDTIGEYVANGTAKSGDDADARRRIVMAFRRRDLSLAACIEQLGPALTSTNELERCRGMQLLSELVAPPDVVLDPTAIDSLIAFLAARLDDFAALAWTARALRCLIERPGLIDTRLALATSIVQGIFRDVTMPALTQPVRYDLLAIIMAVLERFASAMATGAPDAIGPDIIKGVITAIDGERDPRNLMLSFGLVRVLYREMAPLIGPFADDLFETTSCYFPITFKAAPNSPVTSEQIADGLLTCLVGHSSLAPNTIPFLLDKLHSTNLSAQRASLAALSAAVVRFPLESYASFIIEFWDISQQLLTSSDEEVQSGVLQLVKQICSILCPDAFPSSQYHDKFIDPLMTACREEIHVMESSSGRLHARLLASVASASLAAVNLVFASHFDELQVQFLDGRTLPSQRVAIIRLVDSLCNALATFCPLSQVSSMSAPFVPKLVDLLRSALIAGFAQQRSFAFGALATLAVSVPLSDADVEEIVASGTQLLLGDSIPEVREASLLALTRIASRFPDQILRLTVHPLLQQPAFAVDDREADAPKELSLAAVLAHLGQLATGAPMVAADIVYALLRAIGTQARASSSETLSALLDALLGILSCSNATDLYSSSLASIVDIALHRDVMPSEETVAQLERLLRVLFWRGSVEDQAAAMDVLAQRLFPLSDAAPRFTLLPLLFTCINGYRRELSLPLPPAAIIAQLMPLVLSSDTPNAIQLGACRAIASILNKSDVDDLIGEFVTTTLEPLLHGAPSAAALALISWVAKGLVQRPDPAGARLIDRMCHAMADPNPVGALAAASFNIVFVDHDDVLCPSGGARRTVLYKQRVFEQVLPLIQDGIQHGRDDAAQCNYLIGLTNLLRSLPRPCVLEHIDELFPLLLASISSQEMQLRANSLLTLTTLIAFNPSSLADHVPTLVPILLAMTAYKAAARVRIAALECLSSLADQPLALTLAHKPLVIAALEPTLDDPKRIVRIGARSTRSRWFALE